jgi:hypothetical protein
MVTCSKGDHDDCKHILLDALAKIPEASPVRWGQDHVSYPITSTVNGEAWTPSKEAQAKWVDVRFVDLDEVRWNWHLTLENHTDRDFYRAEEGDEPAEPNWASVNVEYNCWIDVIYYAEEWEPLAEFVRPWQSNRADYADELADLVMEKFEGRSDEFDGDKLKFATIGGWTIGRLEMALSEWYYAETNRTLNFLYDEGAPPSPMHERLGEAREQIDAGNTYEIGVLDNGVKVMVPDAVFEQFANMPPEAVAEIMKELNRGPGSDRRSTTD